MVNRVQRVCAKQKPNSILVNDFWYTLVVIDAYVVEYFCGLYLQFNPSDRRLPSYVL